MRPPVLLVLIADLRGLDIEMSLVSLVVKPYVEGLVEAFAPFALFILHQGLQLEKMRQKLRPVLEQFLHRLADQHG